MEGLFIEDKMPETIAAPPAAPVAATPAPVSTPAPPPPAQVSTPEPVSPSVETQPSGETPAPVTPAAPAGTPKGEPKREDFPEGADGEREYMRAQWEYEDGQGAQEAAQPVAEDVPLGDQAEAPAGEKTAEEQAAEAAAKTQAIPEPEDLSTEALNSLIKAKPERDEYLKTDPELNGFIFKSQRELAKAQPIADLFLGSVDSAKFAQKTANETVEIRGNFIRAADDPTQIEPAFERFQEAFREYDDKGQPMVDAAGEPVYGKDFDALMGHVVERANNGSVAWAQGQLDSGKLSEKAAEEYRTYIQAHAFIKEFEGKSDIDLDRPDEAEMSPEQKDWFDRRDAALREKEEQSGLREKQRNTEAQQQARTAHETKINGTVGGNIGGRIKDMVDKDLASGVKLPRYALEYVAPGAKVASFALAIYHNFLEKTVGRREQGADGKVRFVGGDPKLRDDLARLEAMPPSENAANQRIVFLNSLVDQYLPQVYAAEKKRILDYEKGERQKTTAKVDAARAAVQTEPRAGSSPTPAGAMDWDKAYEAAKAKVAKESEGKFLTDRERGQAIDREVARMMF